MARSSFFLFACIGAACVVSSLVVGAANPGGAGDPPIENSLAVQRAVLQARDHLDRSESKKAVDVLEANLARINGDRKYLGLLRDAYRAYVRDLGFAHQPALLDTYQKRLKILDDFEVGKQTVDGPQAIPTIATKTDMPQPATLQQPLAKAEPAPIKVVLATTVAPKADPFDSGNELRLPAAAFAPPPNSAANLLAKAHEEFRHKRYAAAKQLYEQANQADARALGEEGRGCWAYCQLSVVLEQINRAADQPCDWTKLEVDVKNAIAVAPLLAGPGNDILGNIAQRRSALPGTVRAAMPTVAVKHSPRRPDGWSLAETTNFRVFHNQPQEYAVKVAETAEITRAQMGRKWFGKEGEDWSPKCDIYLFANGQEYQQKTGQSPASPGHSKIGPDQKTGRIAVREINLRCDNPALIDAILPHETTHVVLAGQFGGHHVPRWADEGIAVLTEPAEKVQQHRKNLFASLQQPHQLIRLIDLFHMADYPAPAQISVFYAQSVALVEFLSQQKSPVVLTQFVRDGLQEGYESALRKHYGYQSIGELQDRFTERMLTETTSAPPASPGR